MADRTSGNTLPKGVEVRNGAVCIYFMHNRKRHYITTPYQATAEGIKAAVKIRADLVTKARFGVLSDDDIAKARGVEVSDDKLIVDGTLFQDVAQKYIKQSNGNLDTRKGYLRILEHHWMPHFALVPIHKITTSDIKELIADKEFKTAKTLNNSLIPLRGVFNTAIEMKLIKENPMDFIKNQKVQIDIPDPFTRDEMNVLLKWLDNNLTGNNRLYYWYYELAFWCGCRPSELIALRWNDIDFFNDYMRVNKSRVRGIEKNTTKTSVARTVYLNERSKRALKEIKAMGLNSEYVIWCVETQAPFNEEKPPRLRLNAAMKACGIRHRPAYNTRHTYATMLLMDGVNPVFVADQLGHSLTMLTKRYARWIHGEKNKQEIAKLNVN